MSAARPARDQPKHDWQRVADDLERALIALAFYPAFFAGRIAAALRRGWHTGQAGQAGEGG